MPTDDHDYLTFTEAADLLRQAEGTMRHWCQVQYGPVPMKVGKRLIYKRQELIDWMEDQRLFA